MEVFNDRLNVVIEMLKRYNQIPELYEEITSRCKTQLMSKDRKVSSYGMFLPDCELEHAVLKYDGKLTTNADKANYKYYFDEKGRIVLTERHYRDEIDTLHYIFYFYTEDSVEILWYHVNRQVINMIAKIQYQNQRIYSFFETGDLVRGGHIDIAQLRHRFSFKECTYHYKEDELELFWEFRRMDFNGNLDVRNKTTWHKIYLK